MPSISSKRFITFMKAHHLSQAELSRLFNVSSTKIGKIVRGEQTLPVEGIGILLTQFEIAPKWLFGLEGNDEEVVYIKDLVSTSEVELREKQIQELKNELGEVYKQLAEERRK